METISKFKTVRILGVPITCSSFDEILETIDEEIQRRNSRNKYISITNTESLYHALRIPAHKKFITNAAISCCDGSGVVLAGKMLGFKIPRLHGPDLMLKCCEHGINRQWRHFFYGGKKRVPERLSQELKKKHPGMITAGTLSPPFRPLTQEEDEKVIEMINKSKPDILWVGLGLLKQEIWVAQHLGKIDVTWMIGVGAAFDFYSGTVKRAPAFYRRLGLEWLYRAVFEPRMIKRNFYSSLIFFPILKEIIYNNIFVKKSTD
jgi:N-acetylglucosaminyldiphosphoundecaprenol N-acetyl-beta-D-mannosaminyltransferase